MKSHRFFPSRLALCTACLALWFSLSLPLFAQHERVARYSVRMEEGTVPRLHVSASVPIRGNLLTMERTRPGDIPELLKEGWPVLVRDLHITDEAGRSVRTKARSTSGWELEQARNGWLNLAYDVDYSLPASLGWPAPREGGFKDSAHFVLVGRSLFITTPQLGPSLITFDLPHPAGIRKCGNFSWLLLVL